MQVILMEKVVNLGNLGDVVKVKPGYARNYLIPHGKAKRVTPDNMAEFEKRRAELEQAQDDRLAAARALAARLEGMTVQVTRKAGVDGRLFGSVTNFDIAEALEAQGVQVDKAAVRLPLGPLKQVGEAQVQIALHTDVLANITVTVQGEQ
ncbi:MAG: ribosomal protein [Proteobacteria bacterium]|jgi:large subunit ribosomal protein L9|nr:ribosomal protein [Pseudomonadota bacterium]MBS1172261.1 ribosomal protein [Pseudomonadota bacterium]